MGASGGGGGPERQRRPPSQEPVKGDNMERKIIDDALMAIKCCNGVDGLNCDSCPYLYDTATFCKSTKNAKAIEVIEQLIAENVAMLETIKRMAHSGGVCVGCVHMDDEPTILEHCEDLDFDCEKCPSPCACHSCKEGSNYTWRGIESETTTT